MGKFSKWIGGGLGWVFGGPLGAIAGFIIGSIIDSAEIKTHTTSGYTRRPTTPGGFIISLAVFQHQVGRDSVEQVEDAGTVAVN